MKRYSDRKIFIIKRSTNLEDIIKRYNTLQQAKFYVESIGGDFEDYVNEHKVYQASLKNLAHSLDQVGHLQVLDRNFLPNCVFGPQDIVAVIGQDGMVANTMKYLDNQPLIGINPDRSRWDGILLPFETKDAKDIAMEVIQDKHQISPVSMAQVVLSDGQELYAVNDFFIGCQSHTSARYSLTYQNMTENQSSSGIIVSTGMGSTGWMKSILAGADGVTGYLTDRSLNLTASLTLPWDSTSLIYSVREPFPSRRTSTNLTFGTVDQHQRFSIQSHMPENGVIFSDGIESDFLEFTAGMTANIGIADKKGHLVKNI